MHKWHVGIQVATSPYMYSSKARGRLSRCSTTTPSQNQEDQNPEVVYEYLFPA